MRRREFITLLGGAAAAWPLAARAQPRDRMPLVGVLMTFGESDVEAQTLIKALLQRLAELGWADGRNVLITYRWGADERNRARALANDLVVSNPAVIVACAGPAAVAIRQATQVVPVVFAQVLDPVALGLVESLPHPGANITGFSHYESTIVSKWLQLLKQADPRIRRAVIIFDPENPTSTLYLHTIEGVAPLFGVQLTGAPVRDAVGIERAVASFTQDADGAMIVVPNPVTLAHRDTIIGLAARHRLPAMYPYRVYTANGGLMSYGADLGDIYRRAADYVDRILKGEKPGDLPVQQPTKFELIINLKTARLQGLVMPPTLVGLADEVIE
jgi:putative ABC transport system substrate-binding protein